MNQVTVVPKYLPSPHRLERTEGTQHVRALSQTDQTLVTSALPPQPAPPLNKQTHCEMYQRPVKNVNQNQTESTYILQGTSRDETIQPPQNVKELRPLCDPEKSLSVYLNKLNSVDLQKSDPR